MKIKKLPLSQLVEDLDLYPRVQVDSQHIAYMVQSIQSGVTLPPIVIDEKSNRVIDGFHRARAYRRVYGENYEIDCELRSYRTDGDMFADAMALNAGHGRSLTRVDRARCLMMAKKKFRMSVKKIAVALGMSVEAVTAIGVGRIATVENTTEQIPIKRTIQHMAGHELNQRQVVANKKLSGMNQVFYVNQLIELVESELLDSNDQQLMDRLFRLGELIEGMRVVA